MLNSINLSKATYKKNSQNFIWAAGYNIIAIPLAADVLINQGIVVTPAIRAAVMSLSPFIVAVHARLLKVDDITVKDKDV
ncbi:MAG: hypothetical protein KC455_06635 [Carnobacterium sp.]|nr:hypothetical protein [Carnobacterium sp.]